MKTDRKVSISTGVASPGLGDLERRRCSRRRGRGAGGQFWTTTKNSGQDHDQSEARGRCASGRSACAAPSGRRSAWRGAAGGCEPGPGVRPRRWRPRSRGLTAGTRGAGVGHGAGRRGVAVDGAGPPVPSPEAPSVRRKKRSSRRRQLWRQGEDRRCRSARARARRSPTSRSSASNSSPCAALASVADARLGAQQRERARVVGGAQA